MSDANGWGPIELPEGRGARLRLHPGDVPQLSAQASADTSVGTRARAVLLVSRGLGPTEVAISLGLSRQSVHHWCTRYTEAGVPGLSTRAHPPRRTVDDATIVHATLSRRAASAPWSARLLADELGVGRSTIARAWASYGVRPHGIDTFRVAVTPEILGQVTDVPGMVVSRELRMFVLAVRPAGRTAGSRHARHDTVVTGGHTPIALYAALRAARESPAALSRRGPLDLARFLRIVERTLHRPEARHVDLHLVVDGPAAQQHPGLAGWLSEHRRVSLRMVDDTERWLRILRVCLLLTERPALLRGAPGCVNEVAALLGSLAHEDLVLPGPFVWTARQPARPGRSRPVIEPPRVSARLSPSSS